MTEKQPKKSLFKRGLSFFLRFSGQDTSSSKFESEAVSTAFNDSKNDFDDSWDCEFADQPLLREATYVREYPINHTFPELEMLFAICLSSERSFTEEKYYNIDKYEMLADASFICIQQKTIDFINMHSQDLKNAKIKPLVISDDVSRMKAYLKDTLSPNFHRNIQNFISNMFSNLKSRNQKIRGYFWDDINELMSSILMQIPIESRKFVQNQDNFVDKLDFCYNENFDQAAEILFVYMIQTNQEFDPIVIAKKISWGFAKYQSLMSWIHDTFDNQEVKYCAGKNRN